MPGDDLLPLPLPLPEPPDLGRAALAANQAAANSRFHDYHLRRALHTLRRQQADLALFARFLFEAGATPDPAALAEGLFTTPAAWSRISWGLVEAFARWQLTQGYAVPSVNVRLSTLKTYARLAFQAGSLPPGEYALIRSVQGYAHREALRVDDARRRQQTPTRRGAKKAQPVALTPPQAALLIDQPDTPVGRRDRLLMLLLLDHGLRVGEVALLERTHFDLAGGLLRFYRPKVDRQQLHRLTPAALEAARRYLLLDAPPAGIIWRRAQKGEPQAHLTEQGLTGRGLTGIVHLLGEAIGVLGLSAHDCRHYWATQAAARGAPLERLKEAGGWSSLAMPDRYLQTARIANQGLLFEPEPESKKPAPLSTQAPPDPPADPQRS